MALQPGDLLFAAARVPDESPFGRCATILSDQEQARAARFRRTHDRDAFVAAHVLTRVVLARLSNRKPADLHFDVHPGGKPRIAGLGLGFNLSHTRGAVALAVGCGEVGVDIEAGGDLDPNALAAHALTPHEIEALRTAACPRAFFLSRWVSKEAVAKAWGLGLEVPFKRLQGRPTAGGNWIAFEHEGKVGHAACWGTAELQMAIARTGEAPSRLFRLTVDLAEYPFPDGMSA